MVLEVKLVAVLPLLRFHRSFANTGRKNCAQNFNFKDNWICGLRHGISELSQVLPDTFENQSVKN